jgi:hypothetical protein
VPTDTTSPALTDPFNPTVTDTSVTLVDPTLVSPASSTTFTSTSSTPTFGTINTGSTSFTTTTGTTGTTSTGGSLLTGGTTTGTGTTTTGTGTSGSGTTGTTTAPPPVTAQFQFTDPYLNGTPGNTNDDGLPLFGNLLASSLSSQLWGSTNNVIGNVAITGFSPSAYSLTGPGVVVNPTGGFDIVGNAVTLNTATTGVLGDTISLTGQTIMHVDISSTGAVSLNFIDPLGVISYIQSPGFLSNFTITASDSLGNTATTQPFLFQVQPMMPFPSTPTVLLGDEAGANSTDTFFTSGNYIIWGAGGDDVIQVGGGNNLVFGDTGNDTIIWNGGGSIQAYGGAGNDTIVVNSPTFLSDVNSSLSGGAGTDTLQVGAFTGLPQTYNFEGNSRIDSIETISINGNTGTNNTVILNMQDVFDMTKADPGHTVTIQNLNAGYASTVIVDTLGELTTPAAVSTSVGSNTVTTITGTLISNGASVTLIINQGNALPTDGVNLTVN